VTHGGHREKGVDLSDAEREALTELLFVERGAPQGEAALVFGSPHHIDAIAARVAELWNRKAFRRVIFSGHRGEGRRLASAALQRGLPSAVIAVEDDAANTAENVRFSLEWLRQAAPTRTVLAVAKVHAARRCQLTLEKYLPDWRIETAAVDYFGVSPVRWLPVPSFVEKALDELRKIAEYSERGEIRAPAHPRFAPAELARLQRALLRWRAASSPGARQIPQP
jgi:uncharacterized SAM-binding protein YcdF (DUF218 family)